MRRLLLVALLAAAGCSDATPDAGPPAAIPSAVRPDPAAANRPLSRADRLARGAEAESSAVAFAAAGDDASASCAQATGAASAFRDAGRPAEASRWQATADSACAALRPQMEATMRRIRDSLAAARSQ